MKFFYPAIHSVLALTLLCSPFASAQNRASAFSVSGKITDEAGVDLPFASVALYSSSDSSIAGSAASDDRGEFIIPAVPGTYYLKITFLSYREKTVPGIRVERADVKLGKIALQTGDVSLEEVEVKAEKSIMQLQLDKRVFNFGSDISNTGGNALEVLENIPSVTVDIEGNVNLRGSQNVRVLIDGKPSTLAGAGGTDQLRQLQGNMIEKIEVITNPSAKYDAEGESGIINIVLKKDTRKGMNGSFEVTAGYPHNYGGAFNINYRKNKVNIFTGYGLNFRETPGWGYSTQEFSGDTLFSYDRDQERTRSSFSSNLRAGVEYYLNQLNTLTVSALYSYSKGRNDTRNVFTDYDGSGTLMRTVNRTDDEAEDQNNIEAAIGYRKTFAQEGRQLTADFKWNDSYDTENSDINEWDVADTATLVQRSGNIENERNYFAQADYVHPFGKKVKLETGAKATLRSIENDFTVEEQDDDGIWHQLPAYVNNFIYRENVYAAYVIAGSKVQRFAYQAGLRGELSDVTSELKTSETANQRLYFDLFPNAHLSYELEKSNTLQLSYSRRISRPRFRDLLPFFSFSDNRNFFSGNPDLNPEYTHSFELGHLKYWEKGSLLSSVYYRYRTGVVERIIQVDSVGYTSVFPVNLSSQNAFGLEMSSSFQALKWWRLIGNLNFFRALTRGEYEGENLDNDTYAFTGRVTSRMTFIKKIDFQLTFDYRSPQNTAQGRTKSVYALDAGASMDVLKGNGTITFSCRDMFNTRVRRLITEGDGYYSEAEFQWRARQFLVSFSYRLNQKKKQQRTFDEGGEDMGF